MTHPQHNVPEWILYCPTVFDWSIPDGSVDLDNYAIALLDKLERAGCRALAYVVDNGGYAIYSSRVMPRDPLVGGRDLLALLVEQTHKRGMKFVASWMNVHDQAYISREFKEWHQQKANGESFVSLRNAPCLNSPAGDYFAAQFTEVATRYDIDGVYVEGNMARSGCFCPQCRARFAAAFGYGERLIPAYREHNDLQARIRPYLVDGERIAPIGVLVSYTDLTRLEFSPSFVGYYEALTDAHLPFRVVSERQMLSGELEGLRALVLPDVVRMSNALIEAIGAFLRGGGRVVATYRTGMRDEKGQKRQKPATEQWAGIESFEIVVHPCAPGRQGNACLPDRHYFRAVEEAAGQGLSLGDILSFEGSRVEIGAGDGAEVLARVLDFDYARTHATDRTWRFYPGEPIADLILSQPVGAGRLIYVAADLDQAYLVEGKARGRGQTNHPALSVRRS